MNQQQKTNLLIIILLIFLGLAALLSVTRFIIGKKILTESQNKISQIQASLNQPSKPTLTAPVFKTSDPTLGEPKAENTIFIFSSFSCSYCKEQSEILNQLAGEYSKKVLIVWKDFVSFLDLKAKTAAIAARCAQAQNSFWQYHDYLFANQESLDGDLYQTIAQKTSLNLNKFNQCLNNEEPSLLIESDIAEANALQISTTPFLFINGQPVGGLISLEELETMLKLK